MTIVADTGPLYALIDSNDAWNARVTGWWESAARDVVVPVTVLPEVAYLLARRIGPAAEEAFIRSVAQGEFVLEPVELDDIARAADLMRDYADVSLGFVDATVVAVAERLGARELLTTDRRHFTVVRPRHLRSFALLPE